MSIKYTEVEQRLLNVLQDGKPHNPQELLDCLNGDLPTKDNLRNTLYVLRKKLHHRGEEIILRSEGRRTTYIHVRLLSSQ